MVAMAGVLALLGVSGGLLPAVVRADDGSEPVVWAKLLALPVAAMAIVLLVVLRPRVAWWARLLAAVGTAAFLAVSGLLAWDGLPDPGPEFGLGRRVPWVLAACALGVVAAGVYTVGAVLRRPVATAPWDRRTTLVTVAVVVVFAAASLGAVWAANAWTAARNLDVVHADGVLTGQRASALDGTQRWQAAGSEDVVATRGGLVVVAGPGVYAVDPTTGKQRWHYFSWGTSFQSSPAAVPVVSPNGRYVAVPTGLSRGLDLLLEGESESSEVYVFDAVRGRLVGRLDAHGGAPSYVDQDIVVVGDVGEQVSDRVTAYRHDGSEAWQLAPGQGCLLGAVVGLGDSVLVGHNCDGRAKVSVRDATTGEKEWDWEHDGYISPNGVVVPESGADADTVVLDLPGEERDDGGPGRERHLVTALDTESGDTRWSRRNVQLGTASQDGQHSYASRYAAGTLVLAGSRPDATGPPVELVGLDPATGKERWRRKVPIDYVNDVQHELLPTAASRGLGEVVGAVAGRIVIAGTRYDSSSASAPDSVAVKAVDARTGKRVRSTMFPRGQAKLEHAEALHIVGDTVALTARAEDSATPYLVGLG